MKATKEEVKRLIDFIVCQVKKTGVKDESDFFPIMSLLMKILKTSRGRSWEEFSFQYVESDKPMGQQK